MHWKLTNWFLYDSNMVLCRVFPGRKMSEDPLHDMKIYQNPYTNTKLPPVSGDSFHFYSRSRFSWNFNSWTSFEIDIFTPAAEKPSYRFEQFWSLLSASGCINGPPRYITRYKGSPLLHVVSSWVPHYMLSLQALWGQR